MLKMKKLLLILLVIISQNVFAQSDLNLGFEQLDSNGRIQGWNTVNAVNRPVRNAYEGNYAAYIYTFYVNLTDELRLGLNGKGVPFTKRVNKLKGYYKYEYGDNCGYNDSCEAYIFLTKFNMQSRITDTIGKGKLFLGTTTMYKAFEVPIVYKNLDTPDTLEIVFISDVFDKRGLVCRVPNNRFFTIDSLSLDLATATNDIDNLKSSITLHPNPTSNIIHIDWGKNGVTDIVLKDTLGHILLKKAVFTEGVDIDVLGLPVGFYFVELSQNGQHLATRKIIKQ
jgi:Secretion system C-terminal sorting domain